MACRAARRYQSRVRAAAADRATFCRGAVGVQKAVRQTAGALQLHQSFASCQDRRQVEATDGEHAQCIVQERINTRPIPAKSVDIGIAKRGDQIDLLRGPPIGLRQRERSKRPLGVAHLFAPRQHLENLGRQVLGHLVRHQPAVGRRGVVPFGQVVRRYLTPLETRNAALRLVRHADAAVADAKARQPACRENGVGTVDDRVQISGWHPEPIERPTDPRRLPSERRRRTSPTGG